MTLQQILSSITDIWMMFVNVFFRGLWNMDNPLLSIFDYLIIISLVIALMKKILK